MTNFTPPPDSWLIRYPKNTTTATTSNNINQTSTVKTEDTKVKNTVKQKTFKVPEANQLDATCKRYIETSEIPVKSNKSLGTDDHFKSAVCSKNLLKACEKLMTNKDFLLSAAEEDDFDAELSLMNEQSRMEFYRSKYGNRRNSQSLPASPKMDRKNQTVSHNPYFTISKQETRPESSISFLTNLFGITAKKESMTNVAQTYDATSNTTNKSLFSGGDVPQQEKQQKSSQMAPRPHIYREMNIFSPTSM